MVRTLSRCRLVLPAVAIAVVAAGAFTARTGVEAWTTQYMGVSHGVSSATGAAPDIGRSIAIAPDGSVYLAGFLQSDSIALGNLNISTTEFREGFVAKFDADGDPAWLRTYAASTGNTLTINDIEVAPAGDLYLAGSFSGSVTFGSANLTSAGNVDGFIARLDSSGAPISAIAVGGTASDYVADLAYGPADTITAVGRIAGDSVAPSAITAPWPTSPVNDDGVILNVSMTLATVNWTARAGGTGNDFLDDVDAADEGTIAVSGGADTTAPLSIVVQGSGTSHTIVTPNPGSSAAMVVASLGTSGGSASVNWSETIDGTGTEIADGVVIDDAGRVTVAGYGTGPFDVDGVSHTSGRNVDTDLIISQFTADGTPRWSQVIDSGNSRDEVRGMTLAPDGEILTIGRYGQPSNAKFLAMAHSPDGDLVWGPILLGDADNQIGQGVAVSPAGDVYLTGRFAGGPVDPTDPTKTITVNGSSDIVLFGFATQFPPSTTTAPSTTEATTSTAAPTTTGAPTTTTTAPATTTTIDSATTTTPVTTTTEVLILPATGGDTTASTVLLLLGAVGALLTLSARRGA